MSLSPHSFFRTCSLQKYKEKEIQRQRSGLREPLLVQVCVNLKLIPKKTHKVERKCRRYGLIRFCARRRRAPEWQAGQRLEWRATISEGREAPRVPKHPFSKKATMLMNLSCWPCVCGMYVAPDCGKIAERGNMAGAFKLDDASQSLYPLLLLFCTRGTENERHAPVDDPKNTSIISHHLPLAAASLPIMRGREGACM